MSYHFAEAGTFDESTSPGPGKRHSLDNGGDGQDLGERGNDSGFFLPFRLKHERYELFLDDNDANVISNCNNAFNRVEFLFVFNVSTVFNVSNNSSSKNK